MPKKKTAAPFKVWSEATTHFLGVDPGVKGGVCLINDQGGLLEMGAFDGTNPLRVIRSLLSRWCVKPSIAIEAVHAMPGQGVTSMFSFGMSYGRLQGYFEGVGLAYNLIPPQEWQKGLPAGPDGKTRAKAYAMERHGLEPFLATKRSRVAHSGMVDAFCMAHYLRQTWEREEGGHWTPP